MDWLVLLCALMLLDSEHCWLSWRFRAFIDCVFSIHEWQLL